MSGHYRSRATREERDLSAVDRSQRSVFVGNIAYEATEEQIKEVFSQVGPVVHFRLVHDRDTGKAKGYGFCEFVDQQTADSAIRNLNSFEFHGRPLRVDSAAGSDRNVEEIRQLQMTLGGPQEESPYGPVPTEGKAPEAISRAVASLPPEQMFELMKQMRLCVQNNPNEARNMLLQNPQLAYALLQAQVDNGGIFLIRVVMRIVDPQVAITMLHRENTPSTGVSSTKPAPNPVQYPPPFHQQPPPPMIYGVPPPTTRQNIAPVPPATRPPAPASSEDQEKAALLVQVLQMTDEQIQMLEPDERQQVMHLRSSLRGSQ